MSLNKVVITGVGVVSPFGIGKAPLDEALLAGRSAVVSRRDLWEEKLSDLTCWLGAPLGEPLDVKSIPRKLRRSMGRVAMLAYLATTEALEQAQVGDKELSSDRIGISFGSTIGSVASIEEFFSACLEHRAIGGLPANIFFQFMNHTCAANLAHAFGVSNRVLSPSAACASSLQAIGCGIETIEQGRQDIMICGGADELHMMVSACFDLVHAASHGFNDRPTCTPRPFDHNRDGIVCGEGAGAIILESEKSAEARGAEALAQIEGCATTCEGKHMAQPHRESIVRCLKEALDDSGLAPGDIEYVSAHATGTVEGDREEARALQEVFGARNVPVSSLKGHLGHTLGASGAVELAACLSMQKGGYLVPTRNLQEPGEGCEGLDHVTGLRRVGFGRFMKSSFAFGGVNSVLIVKGL